MEIQQYINKIIARDPELNSINLHSASITNSEIKRLMDALNAYPSVASQILGITIQYTEITSIVISEQLVSLRHLDLNNNQLQGTINIPSALLSLETLILFKNQLQEIIIPDNVVNNKLTVMNVFFGNPLTEANNVRLRAQERRVQGNREANIQEAMLVERILPLQNDRPGGVKRRLCFE